MNTTNGTMPDFVFNYISEGISGGKWLPGEKLPSENELCRQLSTSRVSVRSAIGRLVGLGVVESYQGKGTFVRTDRPLETAFIQPLTMPDKENRMNVFEFRKIIEGESAALAAIRASYDAVCAMEESICKMEQGGSIEEIAEQDMAFHHMVAEATGNEIILRVFEALYDTYTHMFYENVARVGTFGAAYHHKILLAIQTRDMQAARQCMLDHLDAALREISK